MKVSTWGGPLKPFQPKRRTVALILLAVAVGLLELGGVFALYLLGVLLTGVPPAGRTGMVLELAVATTGMQPLALLALLLLAATVIRNAVKLLHERLSMQFVLGAMRMATERLFQATFGIRYEEFIRQSTAERVNSMTVEADRFGQAVGAYIRLWSSGLVMVLLVGLLLVVDWRAFAFGVAGGGMVALLMRPLMRLAKRMGEDRGPAGRELWRTINDPLKSYKAIVSYQAAPRMEERLKASYDHYEAILLRAGGGQRLIAPALETGLVGFVVAGILLTLAFAQSIETAIPILVLLIAGAYRMLPALQSLFATWAGYRFNRPAFERIRDELARLEADVVPHADRHGVSRAPGVAMQVQDLQFAYQGGPQILAGIDLDLARGERVGIVGPSGSGKSTLVDLLLGLLQPTRGSVLLGTRPDGTPNILAYVPQESIILDASLLENLDIGSTRDGIDRQRATEVLTQVGLGADSQHPVDLDRPLAEGGSRVSGGQRQRIGLARALYRQPDVLLLDEPTSSLDDVTERHVVDTLASIQGMAMVIVTHRAAPLQLCDKVYRMREGRLVRER